MRNTIMGLIAQSSCNSCLFWILVTGLLSLLTSGFQAAPLTDVQVWISRKQSMATALQTATTGFHWHSYCQLALSWWIMWPKGNIYMWREELGPERPWELRINDKIWLQAAALQQINGSAFIPRVYQWDKWANLEHGVGEEGLQSPLLTVGLGLVLLQQLVKVTVLLAVSQDLQAVLVVPHKLLVDVQHGQQDIEQVGWGEINTEIL